LKQEKSNSSGKLLALLIASLYALFTLIPDSHSLMVTWPWVFIAQVALFVPILWLLSFVWQEGKFLYLDNGLDWLVGLYLIGLASSTVLAEFPNQALWYSIKAMGFIASIYALNFALKNSPDRLKLLMAQGYLNLAFILVSLYLWLTQTYLPEINRLNELQNQYQIPLNYDFNQLDLRNWAPLGHQNYVAGYLLLCFPVFLTLGIRKKGWQSWFWFGGFLLGVINLYTTNSRGGWLGLLVFGAFIFGVLLWRSTIPKLWLSLTALTSGVIIILLGATNTRLQSLFAQLLQGQVEGEIGYRVINAILGWRAGISHPFSGIGLGGVPIQYQKYLPNWGSRESELGFQLHSSAPQLWAEMGIWGIITPLATLILLAIVLFRRQHFLEEKDKLVALNIFGGLLAYAVISLTDFQLDNIAISGQLAIFLACLASVLTTNQSVSNNPKAIAFVGLASLSAALVWLIPIHRAWQLSNISFAALAQNNLPAFVENLTQAQKLAPWQPYYSYQLGWNLGNIGLQIPDKNQQQQLLADARANFQQAIKVSPYWEFGYSNLAWLSLNQNPPVATQNFAQAARLLPAKRGVFYGLGLSLLAQGKVDQAVEAFSLESLRDPLFITNPGWGSPALQPFSERVFLRLEAQYRGFILQDPQNTFWHQCLGGLLWWQGKYTEATQELQNYGTPLAKVILKLSANQSPEPELSQLPDTGAKMAIAAWLNPDQRQDLLAIAWVKETKTQMPDNIKQQLLAGMGTAQNFGEWLRLKPAVWQYRRKRDGFGVVSRHLDGPAPQDFYLVQENVALVNWFEELLPSPMTKRNLDLALQPLRDKLLSTLL